MRPSQSSKDHRTAGHAVSWLDLSRKQQPHPSPEAVASCPLFVKPGLLEPRLGSASGFCYCLSHVKRVSLMARFSGRMEYGLVRCR